MAQSQLATKEIDFNSFDEAHLDMVRQQSTAVEL